MSGNSPGDLDLLHGQNGILERVAKGAPLSETLDALVAFIESQDPDLRCGILLVAEDGRHFRRGSGPKLPEAYHAALDGASIMPPYLGACAEVAHRGHPIVVPDIASDTRYSAAWRDLAMSCGLAALRSGPVCGPDGRVLAAFAMYFNHTRERQAAAPELIEIATHLAAIAIERDRVTRAQLAAHQMAAASEARLATELAATQRLQEASTLLIQQGNSDALYQHILGAAIDLMHADMASMQMLDHERDELLLLAWKGFHPDSAAYWQRISADSRSSCGAALATRLRVIVSDVEACGHVLGPSHLDAFRWSGIRAMQSTPLLSRSGQMVGMISTHWRTPYQPPEHDLRLLDMLARQAADLIERSQVETALRASEERFRALVSASSDAVYRMSADWSVMYHLMGRDFVGSSENATSNWLETYVPPEEQPRVIAAVKDAVRTRRVFELEHQVRRLDGTLGWTFSRAAPILDEANNVIEWFGMASDVTERRQAEQELRQLAETLEQRVSEEIAAREQAQRRLAHAQRMEALGQLAGGIAHDFNNVLQAVQGGASLIERRSADPEGVRRLARMVFEAAGRGSSVTRRLLAFSRRGDLRSEAVNPVSLLASMHEILSHTLGSGIGVRVASAPGLPLLLADKGQLETVLVNLAANARDAMAGNGILTLAATVDVLPRQEGVSANLGQLKPGPYVCLSVSDTGAGMTPEVLARAAEPFFTTKGRGKGTGLGLAMARGFVEQSGGGLHIESTPGQGTTVKLWFPVADGASATLAAISDDVAEPNDETRARLMVVDDDAMVREILTEQLEAGGYTVVAAANGPDALDLLDAGEQVDLIVSDLSMPVMDGVALVREVHRRRPHLPAILLTGFATNAAELAVSGAVSGTFTLLRKPVEGKVLAERVSVLLEGMAAAEERSTDRPC